MSETATIPLKRRRPWIAALFSLVAPGLGQLYNGQPRRAVAFFGLLALLCALVALLAQAVDGSLALLNGAIALVVAAFLLALSAAIDAFRGARRLGAVVLGRYQRPWIYLAVIIIVIAAQETLALGAKSHGGCASGVPREFSHTYRWASGSMQPTLLSDEIFVVDASYFCRSDPRRGDLAAFLRPIANSPVFVKRIIGLPGDRVRLTEGRVYINGEPVAQEWLESGISTDETGQEVRRARYVESFSDGARYVVEISNLGAEYENTPEVTVPADSYFVLGDTRDNSFDSRMKDFGFIPRALIVDRPAYIIWSSDWDRIGLRLR
ncbi:MAG TPA: signal peptidase I [Stellaceae bacterium]|nr:signal peptidase I [Stellaceae bacterium]